MLDPIELVIFDLDGVLVDSEILSAELIITMVSELGAKIDLLYVRRNFIGKNFQSVLANLKETFELPLPENFERSYLARLAELFDLNLKMSSGIIPILERLSPRCCIATSSPPERATNSLRICGLTHFFPDAIFTSSMVERAKPAPDLFLFAAHEMRVEPTRCLVIEDSVAGIEAGLAAGMTTTRYVGGSHLKGLSPVRSPPTGLDNIFDNWANFPSLYPSLF